MYKILSVLFLFVGSLNQLGAQIFPQESSNLCYRLIGFSFPAQPGAINYTIEIAKGNYDTEDSFEKNMIVSISGKKNKNIAEVPSFGCQYTWRVISVTAKNIRTMSILHHFSVKITPDVDTSFSRLRIIKSAETQKDAYFFIDGARVLYNMKGDPVWFLPGSDLEVNRDAYPRDLKVSPQGTITFLTGNQPYEIDYAGNILWHYANDQNIQFFHHEFTRLGNGHYIGMIYEDVAGQLPPFIKERTVQDTYDSAGFYRSRLYSSLVEFDEEYHLVWRWSGLEYLNNSDMRFRRTTDFKNLDHDLHENAFFFDEKNKTVYLSLRDINRIIKIKYPEGNVLNTYGALYQPGDSKMENGLFCFPHCCRRSQKGYLYLYNNNICSASHVPTIIMFQEPVSGNSDLKKIWEYQCTVDGADSTTTEKIFFYGGGSVEELPDQSMLVMMGEPRPKLFIVSLDKKILWSAIPEKYNTANQKWEPFTELYRASFVSRKQLEQMIWRSEK